MPEKRGKLPRLFEVLTSGKAAIGALTGGRVNVNAMPAPVGFAIDYGLAPINLLLAPLGAGGIGAKLATSVIGGIASGAGAAAGQKLGEAVAPNNKFVQGAASIAGGIAGGGVGVGGARRATQEITARQTVQKMLAKVAGDNGAMDQLRRGEIGIDTFARDVPAPVSQGTQEPLKINMRTPVDVPVAPRGLSTIIKANADEMLAERAANRQRVAEQAVRHLPSRDEQVAQLKEYALQTDKGARKRLASMNLTEEDMIENLKRSTDNVTSDLRALGFERGWIAPSGRNVSFRESHSQAAAHMFHGEKARPTGDWFDEPELQMALKKGWVRKATGQFYMVNTLKNKKAMQLVERQILKDFKAGRAYAQESVGIDSLLTYSGNRQVGKQATVSTTVGEIIAKNARGSGVKISDALRGRLLGDLPKDMRLKRPEPRGYGFDEREIRGN